MIKKYQDPLEGDTASLVYPLPTPEQLKTCFDTDPNDAWAQERYTDALETGKNATQVYIRTNGAWGAYLKNGGVVTAYEKLGFHRGTYRLLQGFLDSGVRIVNLCDFSQAYWLEKA